MAKTSLGVVQGAIGDVKSAMLTLGQFQIQNGTGWVLADGSSCVGTAYAAITGFTTTPDIRGQTLRGKNNSRADGQQNPDGDVALGTQQTDSFASHAHTVDINTAEGQHINTAPPASANAIAGSTYAQNLGIWHNTANGLNYNVINAAGGNETRMKNITMNFFIKVN